MSTCIEIKKINAIVFQASLKFHGSKEVMNTIHMMGPSYQNVFGNGQS